MKKMITIIGPTASGKTDVAAHLAYSYIKNGVKSEIISGDSRQVYRGMDIGTGKDIVDYTIGETNIPYHLIDICNPGEKYNIYRYQKDFLQIYKELGERNALPILCGGSGLYIESVVRGYHLSTVPQNKELRQMLSMKNMQELAEILQDLKDRNKSDMHNKTDVDSPQRAIRAIEIETYNLEHKTADREFPDIDTCIIGINIDREERRKKISNRLKSRLDEGMIDEIRGLINNGVSPDDLIYYGLEYKYVTEYILGKYSYEEMYRQLEIAIHQFAKRQMTWFRGMERRGCTIHWVEADLPMNEKVMKIEEIVKEERK